ncbi:DUF4169 family protein [Planktotalea sp.]|uniref:DUF4169 family protein n=1 Tax=Planktotalea sp. TaxID=2029877 RepID=UPI0032998CD9
MGKPVNLNRYRKEKARAEKSARAEQNALAHGRTKAERDLEKARRDLARKLLDGAKRDESKPD